VRPLSIPAAGVTISLSFGTSRVNVAATPSIVIEVTVRPRKSRLNSDSPWVARSVMSADDTIVLVAGS
jgi:hypothetical protein